MFLFSKPVHRRVYIFYTNKNDEGKILIKCQVAFTVWWEVDVGSEVKHIYTQRNDSLCMQILMSGIDAHGVYLYGL